MRIVSVIGRKDAGKTTLLIALAREFKRQGKRVMTIKHASHPAVLDHEGTDTWRHFHEGARGPDARFDDPHGRRDRRPDHQPG